MITTINHKTLTVYEMTGSDVLTFLNNQTVSELKQTHNTPRLTAICNPKGRIIFTLFLYQDTATTLVAVDSSLSDNFLQYINMRRFRMDVKINKSPYLLGINNAHSQPESSDELVFTDDTSLTVSGADTFWLYMFKTGLPWITAETTESFIPQHLNMDQLGVIDFDKGCYPGQEIIARLHFLGKVKKRMQHIHYQTEQAHAANSKAQLPEYEAVIEFCAPSIMYQGNWHTQAIIAC